MATSLLGIDYEYFRGLLLSHYRGVVRWPGAPWDEPVPTSSGSTPTDWIYPVMLRNEARAYNVENDQGREVTIAIYGALQPDRGGFTARLDAIHADLLDALSLSRATADNTFDDSFTFLGQAEQPVGHTLSNPWLWYAWRVVSMNYEQVA